jgi:hypothetical protein
MERVAGLRAEIFMSDSFGRLLEAPLVERALQTADNVAKNRVVVVIYPLIEFLSRDKRHCILVPRGFDQRDTYDAVRLVSEAGFASRVTILSRPLIRLS